MYHVSTELAEALASQRLHIRVTCGDTVLDADQVTGLTYTASCGGGESLTIGGVCAATLTLAVAGQADLLNQTIAVEVGTELAGEMQYIPLGTFAVAEQEKLEDSTSLVAYDAVYSALGGTYVPQGNPVTALEVLRDIAGQCGLTLVMPWGVTCVGTAVVGQSHVSRDVMLSGELTGYTCREMAGLMAGLLGRNVAVNRAGELCLPWFIESDLTLTPDDYYSGGLVLTGNHALTGIRITRTVRTVTTEEDGTASETETTETLEAGTVAGEILTGENDYMTQSALEELWSEIGALGEYRSGSCAFAGGLLLEPGDLVEVLDPSGASGVLPVMTVQLEIDGGCRCAITSDGQSATAEEAAVRGPITQTLDRVRAEIAEFKELSAENLEAVRARINTLYTDEAWISRLFSQDITATGTIHGAKLRGDVIDIYSSETTSDGETFFAGLTGTVTDLSDSPILFGDEVVSNYSLYAGSRGDYAERRGSVSLDSINGWLTLQSARGSSLSRVQIRPEYIRVLSELERRDSYTGISIGAVSDGTVLVVKKMGWCQVSGSLTLTGAVSDWTAVLTSAQVPPPQHGTGLYDTAHQWGASYTRPLRVGIGANGTLNIRYGAAGTYVFTLPPYPVD